MASKSFGLTLVFVFCASGCIAPVEQVEADKNIGSTECDGGVCANESCESCDAGCARGEQCDCTPESELQFCERLNKTCDSVSATDNCGMERTANCGTCQGLQICGVDNLCISSADVRPSAGCGLAGAPGVEDVEVTIRGVQRNYKMQFPANYDANDPLPLIFYFHWMGGTIADVLALDEPALWEVGNASNEAAFVWPQGLAKYGNNEPGWDLFCDGEDMEFFDAMLNKISESRCIDLSRVFSTGFSFGADMSVSLACCHDHTVIRAVAPASGAFDQDNNDFVCPGLSPPSIRYTYGTNDPVYTIGEFKDVVDFFHTQLGCSSDYDTIPVSPCDQTWTEDETTVSCGCKAYQGCSRPVVDCEFENLGHTTADGWREDTWDYFMSF